MPEEHFKRSLLSVVSSSGFSQNQLEVIIITASKKILDLTNRMNGVDLSSAENVAEKFCSIVQGKLNSHV